MYYFDLNLTYLFGIVVTTENCYDCDVDYNSVVVLIIGVAAAAVVVVNDVD